MKDKEFLLASHALVLLCALILGCQNNNVSYSKGPDNYQFVKWLEEEVLSTTTTNTVESGENCGKESSLPDYFGFRRAVKMYEAGRMLASCDPLARVPVVLSVYSETNLVDQAVRDGYEEQLARNLDKILARNQMRKQRQLEFWGVYDMDQQDDTEVEESNITTNCYVHLMSSYAKGYRNGYRVVAKLRDSPIATTYCLASVNLCADMLKRAYVYGWYSACYDYFCSNPKMYRPGEVHSGRDPRDYYEYWISLYKTREREFLDWNAKKQECERDK